MAEVMAGAVRGQYAFLWTSNCKFWRENFWADLGENKRGLGMFLGKVQTMTSWNISVAFLENCLSISKANECLPGINMKQNQQALR